MSNKELKILCWILALGQAGWAFAWWTQLRTAQIHRSHIHLLESHLQ